MPNEPSAPPATDDPSGRILFVSFAAASWITFVLAVALIAGVAASHRAGGTPYPLIALTVSLLALALVGILSGILALRSTARQGTIGIRTPAITGLALWLLMGLAAAGISVARYITVRQREIAAAIPVQLEPAVHAPGATVLRDAELGFTVDLPEDFQPFAEGKNPPGYRYAYIKPGVVHPGHVGEDGRRVKPAQEPNRVFAIKPLGLVIPKNQYRNPTDLSKTKGMSLVTFNWRGLSVDAARVLEKSEAGPYVTFNIRIPVKKQALIFSFGGPALAEPEIAAQAGDVLATLDAETNW